MAEPEIDFEAVFDALPGVYLVLTPTFDMVAANEARLRATMTTREEIIGKNLFDIFPDNPDDPGADGVRNLRTSLERVVQTKTPDAMAVQKYDIRKPESEGGGFEVRYWSPINLPILGADGAVRYIVHRVEDITDFMLLKAEEARLQSHADRVEAEIYQRAQEVQEANRRFERANIELERLYEKTKELDATKTRFFANISHELRTPLTLVLGPVERLLAEETLPDSYRRSLDVVRRNAQLLHHHVNDLLDIAKLDAGKMEVRYIEADLAHLLRAMCGHFESMADERGIAFQVDAPSFLLAEVDSEKVQRVLLNLLSNAFKFTPDGGEIACRLSLTGEHAHITVQDSGPGVPEHLREIIFEPFRQGDEEATRKFEGTGLGLAIAKEFLDLLGGRICVRDGQRGGAVFEVTLPIFAPADALVHADAKSVALVPSMTLDSGARAGPPLASVQDAASPYIPGRPRILVVEDNREMSQFIADGLSSRYEVVRAFTGREGAMKAVEIKPDLILSDMMMPEMSGEELVRELRGRPDFGDTPIILLTAKADEDTRIALLRIGAQDVLSKPFNSDELAARVSNFIAAKRASESVRKVSRVSEEKRRLLMDNAGDAFLIVDEHGLILEANKQAERLFRRGADDLAGRTLNEIARPADAAFGALADVLHGPRFQLDAFELDVGGDTPVFVDIAGHRVVIDGEWASLITMREVSDRIALELQLRRAQKLEAMGQLTGGVAHDFNNLLTVITTMTDLLGSAVKGKPELLPLVDSIDRAADRGAQLISRLLAFSRKQPLKQDAVALNPLVERVTLILERTLGGHIDVATDLDSDAWPVFADASQIEDALLNLAVNARDAMASGGRLRIETKNIVVTPANSERFGALAPGEYGVVSVADTGIGMSTETIAQAIEPFFTTKEIGRGTGLGLSMVYGFAKQSNGNLLIESVLGEGTRVSLFLPRAPGGIATALAQDMVAPGRGRGETILLVDDDEDVRHAAQALLADLGYHVITAGDAAAALVLLSAPDRIDLLLTDIIMPGGMTGVDLAKAAERLRPDLKVLFASGFPAFVEAGVDTWKGASLIAKPYRKATMGEAVYRALHA